MTNLIKAAFVLISLFTISNQADAALIGRGDADPVYKHNYDYVSAGISSGSIDILGGSIDGDGFSIGLSLGLTDNFSIALSASSTSLDFDIKGDETVASVNFHMPMSNSTDVFFEFGSYDIKLSQPFLGQIEDSGTEEAPFV